MNFIVVVEAGDEVVTVNPTSSSEMIECDYLHSSLLTTDTTPSREVGFYASPYAIKDSASRSQSDNPEGTRTRNSLSNHDFQVLLKSPREAFQVYKHYLTDSSTQSMCLAFCSKSCYSSMLQTFDPGQEIVVLVP